MVEGQLSEESSLESTTEKTADQVLEPEAAVCRIFSAGKEILSTKIAMGCDPNATGLMNACAEFVRGLGHEVTLFPSEDPIYARVAIAVGDEVLRTQLIAQPSIDGLFTGRSAWQADAFDKLIRDAMASAAACGKH